MHRLAFFLVLFFSFSFLAPAQEKKRFVLYASLLESTPVQLSDGAKWQMDKGDTFPIVMFKEQRTKVILQLAGSSFMINTDRVRVIEEKDATPEQLTNYRNNVANYLESRAAKWKTEVSK